MPTRKTIYWLIAAVALYLIAWNVGSGWLYILTTLLIALPLVSIPLSRMNVRRLTVSITAPESLTSGELLPVLVEVRNNSWLPHFFLDIDFSYAGSRQKLFVSAMGPHESRELTLEFNDMRRGSYDSAQILISSSAPAGLARSRRQLEAFWSLVVYPVWHNLSTDWDSGQKNAGYMVSSSVPTRNAASDYIGVREYRPEDSPRSIHWRSSARSGKLASIEYSRQAAITPVLILDSFRDANLGKGPASTFETAVIVAASLVQRDSGHNRRFGIGSSPGDAGIRSLGLPLDEAMDWLAQVEATTEQTLDLSGHSLPWPEATPVLLLTSHTAYSRLDQANLLQEFPHSIVIMLDGRKFENGGRAGSSLMDTRSLDDLADRLESMGAEFILITSREEVPECLADL
ncbi:MAG: DUF58 domain-containing protein [Thermoleophilia bacterium]|nr:DUF58 domain-containing protein [Thermoleophilia bacterium]